MRQQHPNAPSRNTRRVGYVPTSLIVVGESRSAFVAVLRYDGRQVARCVPDQCNAHVGYLSSSRSANCATIRTSLGEAEEEQLEHSGAQVMSRPAHCRAPARGHRRPGPDRGRPACQDRRAAPGDAAARESSARSCASCPRWPTRWSGRSSSTRRLPPPGPVGARADRDDRLLSEPPSVR